MNISEKEEILGGVQSNDDYQTGLSKLWGLKTLRLLRTYVRNGDIEEHNISAMARRMGCRRTYNQNKFQLDLVETFEKMLEEWFNQNLFDFSPSDAKDELVKVLIEGQRGSDRFVTNIKRLCDSHR